jgi:uncharacterized protein (TIGR04255 family)
MDLANFLSASHNARLLYKKSLGQREREPMVVRGTPLPRQLEPDAILEALLEVRFDAPTVLPEVLFGRLAEHAAWKDWQQLRLPPYDIPAPLREANPTLRVAPIFELTNAQSHRSVRIGPRVISYHVGAPYPGWAVFQGEINQAVDELFARVKDLRVIRLGLRYINALTHDRHFIKSANDLAVAVTVSGDVQTASMNLNYNVMVRNDTVCTVRVATRDFVQGVIPDSTTVLADVDVATIDSFSTQDAGIVKDWAVFAHQKEKEEFFHLLTPEIVTKLTQGARSA